MEAAAIGNQRSHQAGIGNAKHTSPPFRNDTGRIYGDQTVGRDGIDGGPRAGSSHA